MWEVSRQAGCHLALQHYRLPVGDMRRVESEKTREREELGGENRSEANDIQQPTHQNTHPAPSNLQLGNLQFVFLLIRPTAEYKPT